MNQKNQPIMEQALQHELKQISDKVGDVVDKVDGVLSLLKGNPFDKDDDGILGEVSLLKKEVERLKNFKTKVIYISIGASLPASIGLLEFFKQVMQKLSS